MVSLLWACVIVDSTSLRVLHADRDGDGFGDSAIVARLDRRTPGWVDDASDCDDTFAFVHPGAPETCDLRDEDCDGTVDEDAVDATIRWADADGDGYGAPETETVACNGGVSPGLADCDDTDADVHPAATDRLCLDGVDADCDGEDACTAPRTDWFARIDGDPESSTGLGLQVDVGSTALYASDDRSLYRLEGPFSGTSTSAEATMVWEVDEGSFRVVGDWTGDGREELILNVGEDYELPADYDIDNIADVADGADPSLVYAEYVDAWVSAMGDVDGDGVDDVAVRTSRFLVRTKTEAVTVTVYPNPAHGGDPVGTILLRDLYAESGAGAAADVDGDGLDTAFVSEPGRVQGFDLSGGATVAAADATYTIGAGGGDDDQLSPRAAGDLDGDGLPDLFLWEYGTTHLVTAAEWTAGTKLGDVGTRWAGVGAVGPPVVADVDGDGTLDVAFADQGPDEAGFWLDLGPIQQGAWTTDDFDLEWARDPTPAEGVVELTAGDLDGDGRAELYVGNPEMNVAGVGTIFGFAL